MSVHLQAEDLHQPLIPEVTVEFATIDELDDEGPLSRSTSFAQSNNIPTAEPSVDIPAGPQAMTTTAEMQPDNSNKDTADMNKTDNSDDGPSPMENEEFAYPSNLTSGTIEENGVEKLQQQQEQQKEEYSHQLHSKSPTVLSQSSKDIDSSILLKTDDIEQGVNELLVKRGHSRIDNPSSGSDLVQVSVEDLLISEELDRTIRANTVKNNTRQHGQQVQKQLEQTKKFAGDEQQQLLQQQPQQQQQEEEEQQQQQSSVDKSVSSTSISSNANITVTTITATIRATGDRARSILFDDDIASDVVQDKVIKKHEKQQQQPPAPSTATNVATSTSRLGNRISHPPAPNVLTPAQQRDAEADANIQKAIELHENNHLEEATRYFRLAAQSENPLGQLMYGLSLRHGWGCKANPTEAIVFLQRAAEYAMGELNELNPIAPPTLDNTTATAEKTSQQQQPQSPIPSSPKDDTLSEKHGCGQDVKPVESSEKTNTANNNSASELLAGHQALRRMGSMDRSEAMAMARKELVMALYELGMSYLKGWGVIKNKAVAFMYFKIAADLGDADSQNETALCYYEGIGIDKDMYESAKYYRMAAAQGASQLGNSWIWKPKYEQYCAAENAGTAVGVSINNALAEIKKPHHHHQDRSKRLATAIQTAFQSGSSTLAKGHANKDRERDKESMSSLSPPASPAIPSPQYSISSIASGLASVTAATAGVVVPSTYSNSDRRSLISSQPLTPSSTPPSSGSGSNSVSKPQLPSSHPPPTSSSGASGTAFQGRGRSQSAASASVTLPTPPTSAPSPSTNTSITSPLPPPSSSLSATGEFTEKKKTRWSIWGGLRPSSSVVAPSPSPSALTSS
ncbi:hypothetical protein EDD11_004041 [Mortierella claussenii]|nr:hypothetical protein EDD11_004041 [Mortierella claussenii]